MKNVIFENIIYNNSFIYSARGRRIYFQKVVLYEYISRIASIMWKKEIILHCRCTIESWNKFADINLKLEFSLNYFNPSNSYNISLKANLCRPI